MAAQPARRQFTVAEYYQMGRVGILTEDDRVELIEGEIIEMPPIGGRHSSCVNRLNELFVTAVGSLALVTVQNPLRLDGRSEPVPDVMIVNRRTDFYEAGHPAPEDVLLLVEVSDSTIGYDRRVKLPLYAQYGVPEVWIVDLDRGVIRVHLDPMPDGYRVVRTRRRGDRLAPAAFPDLVFAVDDILG
jgi:Uma2 family endonuclease